MEPAYEASKLVADTVALRQFPAEQLFGHGLAVHKLGHLTLGKFRVSCPILVCTASVNFWSIAWIDWAGIRASLLRTIAFSPKPTLS